MKNPAQFITTTPEGASVDLASVVRYIRGPQIDVVVALPIGNLMIVYKDGTEEIVSHRLIQTIFNNNVVGS